MILTIDIGNSDTVLGIYEDKNMIDHWRVSTDRKKTVDEYGILLNNLFSFDNVQVNQIKGVIISSVVPQVVQVLEETTRRYLNLRPMIIGPGIKTGMNIKMEDPREVGADRIVNAVGGYQNHGGPLIIVDFGTATTFDYISANGDYEGGAISPGIGVSTDALFKHASKLPRVELRKPSQAVGKNTVEGTQSGIFYGFIGQVEKVINEFKKEIKGDPKIIATGGYSRSMGSKIEIIDIIEPFLTLDGLYYLAKKNDIKKVSQQWRLQEKR